MLVIPAPKSLRRRHARRRAPQGPIIQSATYNAGGTPSVTITFDRSVDTSAFDVSKIKVDDGTINQTKYEGVGSFPSGPHQIHVNLAEAGLSSETRTLLSVLRGNGIIATDTKAELAPVANLELPYP